MNPPLGLQGSLGSNYQSLLMVFTLPILSHVCVCVCASAGRMGVISYHSTVQYDSNLKLSIKFYPLQILRETFEVCYVKDEDIIVKKLKEYIKENLFYSGLYNIIK